MQVSLNWIRKYVELAGTLAENPHELSKALTSLGLEVEGMTITGAVPGVVSAEVIECAKHPEADKLSVCKVTDGGETYPVVCGAPNVAKGQKVLFAKVGAQIPGKDGAPGFAIKKAKLRGQESHGMICAEDEVGLGDSHDGILVLPAETPLGLPMEKIPGLSDVIFELNVTPNRPDALCHIGVAREIAAKFGKPLRYPEESLHEKGAGIGTLADLELRDLAGCTKYLGRAIQGVKVGPSPEWLVKALKSIGKRSINNVVDLTNYVLFETGQPSHAFDLSRIRGKKVIIRKAAAGEKLTTLDGVERELTEADMVIADAEGPMVLAGVMGGKDSEVSEATTDIFLEVAYFTPAVVRRQGRRHGLSSDSSYRFERGIDPLRTAEIADYLAALIARWCGGTVAQGRLEKASPEHPSSPRRVFLRPSRAESLLGAPLSAEECVRRLGSIGLKVGGVPGGEPAQVHGQAALAFSIPGFRGDLEREADLIEEIARLGDYNAIPVTLPTLPLVFKALPPAESLSRTLRHHLRDAGLNETLSLRFSSRKALAKLGLPADDARMAFVPLRNPLSEEWEILPTTPLPSLLAAAAYNQNNQERNIRFFEIGRCFYHRPEERTARAPGVWEEEMLCIVLAGDWPDRRPWSGDPAVAGTVEFFHLKGLLENLLAAAGVQARLSHSAGEAWLHPVESGAILADLGPAPAGADVLFGRKASAPGGPARGAERIGTFGMLHPRTVSQFDLKGPVLAATISLSGLLAAAPRAGKFKAFGNFSAVTRDLNLLVDEGRTHAEIVDRIPKGRIPNLAEVRLNSVYRGTGVPEGKKALHYTFTYRNTEKTLTDDEVNKSQEKVHQELAKDAGIAIK
jgi:phenylalanyl-tRNA synthetase beta chain